MKRPSTLFKLFSTSPSWLIRSTLFSILMILAAILLSTSKSYSSTNITISSGAYDDCSIWLFDCASDQILWGDTVIISHDITLSSDINVDGVLIVNSSGIISGVYQVNVSEIGELTNDGILNVYIDKPLLFFIPNAFSPNGDELNNTFTPIFEEGHDPYDYNLLVFNRYGNIIFESYDPNIGWDGNNQNGTYTWKIEFGELKTDKRHSITGHVCLVQ